ncbi:MAG: V-type ATPase subunit [Candidatus Hodarchaeales archaeon]
MVGIEDVGYINARFHGLRSHLLSSSELIEMTEVSSLSDLIQLLRGTSYREFIQRTLLLGDELYSIDTALNEYVSSIAKKILRFTEGEIKDIFIMLFSRFDVSNLKIALQGLVSDVVLDESLMPCGQLSIGQLSKISRANDLKEAYDILYTYRSPLARPLRDFINKELDFFLINTALDKYYFENIFDILGKRLEMGKGNNIQIALEMFREELEYVKLSFIVNFISLRYKKELQPDIDLQPLVYLYDHTVRDLVQEGDITGMISFLKRSRYRSIFEKYKTPKNIAQDTLLTSELEKCFVLKQIRKAHLDRESIVMGLSYFWQLYSELRNMRLISHGIFGSVQREIIRRNLIV